MTGRLAGAVALLGVTAGAAGIAAGATLLPRVLPAADTSPAPAGQRLPGSRSVPTLVCPGPETLLVPDGGQPVDAGAAVLFRALLGTVPGGSVPGTSVPGGSGPAASGPGVSAAGASPVARLRLLGGDIPPGIATHAPAARSRPDGLTTGDLLTLGGDSLAKPDNHSAGASADPGTSAASGSAGSAGSRLVLGSLAATALGPALFTSTSSTSSTSTVPSSGPSAGSGTLPVSLAAVQSTLAHSGNLRGLTATTCTAPQSESWLVGGGTKEGERLRLLLANPASEPAVVDVDLLGPSGRVSAPSGEGVVVPPGAELPIYLDALAPGLKRVAVHVSTRSGRIRATLNDSLLRGLAPAGTDDVPVAAPPAKRQVVSGISLVNGFSKTAADPAAAGSTAVRIAVPGTEDAVVRVRLLGADGEVQLPSADVVSVPGGQVVDVPISGIPSGNYTAVVDSDVPVVAGAVVGRAGPAGDSQTSEFAWAAASLRLSGDGYAVLPRGARAALSVVAPGKAGHVTLTEVHDDGALADPVDVDVASGTSITLQLADDTVAVKLAGLRGASLMSSIVSTVSDPGGTLISVLPVNPPAEPAPSRTAIEDSHLGLR